MCHTHLAEEGLGTRLTCPSPSPPPLTHMYIYTLEHTVNVTGWLGIWKRVAATLERQAQCTHHVHIVTQLATSQARLAYLFVPTAISRDSVTSELVTDGTL